MWLALAWTIAGIEGLVIAAFLFERFSLKQAKERSKAEIDVFFTLSETLSKAIEEAIEEIGITQIEGVEPDSDSPDSVFSERKGFFLPKRSEKETFSDIKKLLSGTKLRFSFEGASYLMSYAEILPGIELEEDFKAAAKREILSFIEKARKKP